MSDLFTRMWIRVTTLFDREDGQAVTEYAIVLAVIALIAGLVATSGIGTSIIGKVTTALSRI